VNPQPPPSGGGDTLLGAEQHALRYGARVARELVRVASTAHLLGLAFEPGDEICPPPRTFPHIPVPIPFPVPDPYPWYRDETIPAYAAGFAFELEASAIAWQQLKGAQALEALHATALRTAAAAPERLITTNHEAAFASV
jgi:hypothetical protein